MKPQGIQLRSGGCWILPVAAAPDDAVPVAPIEVPRGLKIQPGETFEGDLTLFDSWEWSLWHEGHLLVGDGASLRFVNAHHPEQPIASFAGAAPPRFGFSAPTGAFAELVGPRLGLRAAMPVAKVAVRQHGWDLRNEDDKVVVRLVEQTWNEKLRTLSLVPLRGYDDEARLARRVLGEQDSSDRHPLAHALESAGVRPRVWTNKPPFEFRDDAPAHGAVVDMIATMVTLARETEAGIIEDIDTEFLHDYRVLIRKARSVLSLTKGVLEAAATAELKAQLKALAQRTNLLRDLDVHLMDEAVQVSRVPARLREGLQPLFADIARRRAKAQAEVGTVLKGARYRREADALLERIRAVGSGPHAGWRVRKLADKKIASQLAKVRAGGRSITANTPDEAVHALRIECKKLRYLLEFFRHLYPSDRVAALVKSLKRLQDVLGAFNDFSVQQEALDGWLATTKKVPTATAVSVGALLGALEREQTAVRTGVEVAFKAFDDAAGRPLVNGKKRPRPGKRRTVKEVA